MLTDYKASKTTSNLLIICIIVLGSITTLTTVLYYYQNFSITIALLMLIMDILKYPLLVIIVRQSTPFTVVLVAFAIFTSTVLLSMIAMTNNALLQAGQRGQDRLLKSPEYVAVASLLETQKSALNTLLKNPPSANQSAVMSTDEVDNKIRQFFDRRVPNATGASVNLGKASNNCRKSDGFYKGYCQEYQTLLKKRQDIESGRTQAAIKQAEIADYNNRIIELNKAIESTTFKLNDLPRKTTATADQQFVFYGLVITWAKFFAFFLEFAPLGLTFIRACLSVDVEPEEIKEDVRKKTVKKQTPVEQFSGKLKEWFRRKRRSIDQTAIAATPPMLTTVMAPSGGLQTHPSIQMGFDFSRYKVVSETSKEPVRFLLKDVYENIKASYPERSKGLTKKLLQKLLIDQGFYFDEIPMTTSSRQVKPKVVFYYPKEVKKDKMA